MLLRSFNFTKQLTGDMLDTLFKDLVDYRGEFDYSLELIEAALDGRVDTTKPFNLFGWSKSVRDGSFQVELRRLKKEMYIVDDDDDERTGVKASSIVDVRDDYEILEDKEEVQYTVNKILALNNEVMCVLGIDLIFCMQKAIEGVPQAIEELSNICKENEWIGEYVQIILASGIPFEELFPEQVVPFCKPQQVEEEISNVKVG